MKRYSRSDVGCYADGAHGSAHVRETLLELLDGLRARLRRDPLLTVAKASVHEAMDAICEAPSDDLSEEDKAIDVLNTHACEDGVYFGMRDGDLMLLASEQWEDEA